MVFFRKAIVLLASNPRKTPVGPFPAHILGSHLASARGDLPRMNSSPALNSTEARRIEWPSTHWTALMSIQDRALSDSESVLGRVVERYQDNLVAHLSLKFGVDYPHAQDLVQGFLLERVLKGNLLSRADRGRGRFRNFLLRSIDNYAMNVLRHENAQQRRPPGGVISLDELAAREHSINQAIDLEFDKAWAMSVMEQCCALMEAECSSTGRSHIWSVFSARLLEPMVNDASPRDYEALATELGFESRKQVMDALTTGKRMFQRVLRSLLHAQAVDSDHVEEEIRVLMEILSK